MYDIALGPRKLTGTKAQEAALHERQAPAASRPRAPVESAPARALDRQTDTYII